MKLLMAFLSLIFIPTLCFGDMVGFSGDTRRYVTDEEKSQFPYNSVVRLVNNDGVGTGTFVSESVILTCRNVVDGIGIDNNINYSMSGGNRRTGFVAEYTEDKNKATDYSIIVDKGAFTGSVLPVSDVSKQSDNLMVIGYDNLKPLSNDELKIIKQLYYMWLVEHDDLTAKNANQAMQDIDDKLKKDYACSSDNTTDCVRCSNNGQNCIFGDNNNMKVRNGCKISYVGDRLYTNCPVTPGALGAAMIDTNTKQIVGVLCEIRRPQIGQEKEAISLGTKPEYYSNDLKVMIDYIKYGDEEEY